MSGGIIVSFCLLPSPPPTPHSPRSPGPWEGGEVPTQPLTASVFDM